MKIKHHIVLLSVLVLTSCTSEKSILFDEATNAVQEAGHTLSLLNVPDMRCLQGVVVDGTTVVFMQLYCSIENNVDMINFALNTAYSPRSDETMYEVLELIDFTHIQSVAYFLSEEEDPFSLGEQIVNTIGDWRVSAQLNTEMPDAYIFVSLLSHKFMEEIGEQ